MNFTGFCSYPLGGTTTGMLILTTSAAFAATMYATISCRFVVVTFTSDQGGLEAYFDDGRGRTSLTGETGDANNGELLTYKAAVGLYQWLRPTDMYDWSQGSCFGYQETMIASITDPYFDVSRSCAVFAVMLAIFQGLWMFLSACLSMNRIQCFIFCLLSFAGTISTGLTFLFHKSALCETEFESRDCSVDEGGLVMMTACVLWLMTFCIAICFVVPTVLASTSTVDFARSEHARDRAKLAAAAAAAATSASKHKTPKSKTKNSHSREVASTPKTDYAMSPSRPNDSTNTTIQQSYSYDSQSSWTRRIPKRSKADDSAGDDNADHDPSRLTATTTVDERDSYGPLSSDHVRRHNTTRQPHVSDAVQLYITKRLDRIEELSNV